MSQADMVVAKGGSSHKQCSSRLWHKHDCPVVALCAKLPIGSSQASPSFVEAATSLARGAGGRGDVARLACYKPGGVVTIACSTQCSRWPAEGLD